MTFAYRSHFRCDQLHLRHAAIAGRRQREESEFDQNSQHDDGPTPVAEYFLNLLHQPENGFGNDREPAIVFD